MMRVVVVDDEPLARDGLRLRLEREPDVRVVGEAGNGDAALAVVREQLPDVLFLDVRMPGDDGFATLARIAEVHLPRVVFVTAYDAHAVQAFAVHAVDYLLKPIDDARLADALDRLRHDRARDEPAAEAARVAGLLAGGVERAAALERFVVRERGRFRLVPVAAVSWIESAGNYIEVHAADGVHLVRMTLAEAEARLPGFARIHRTRLVCTARVVTVEPNEHGDYRVGLDDGAELPMSRRFRDRLLGT